jgi:WD40 repeat protein
VRVWDATTYAELVRFEVHRTWVMSVAWDEDGTRLASGGDDGTVRLWDATTYAELARLEGRCSGRRPKGGRDDARANQIDRMAKDPATTWV